MEGAGASIVSHAAELATRDMDKEPELPSAIHDLVRRLEGQGEPITRLPNLSGPKFVDFFPNRESLSAITGWRRKVHLRVLEALGSCNTLEVLRMHDIFGTNTDYVNAWHTIWRLTASEWEIVLRGFRSSSVPREIIFDHLAEPESWSLQLGTILNTSSVRVLRIISCSFNARCYSSFASGLRGNPDSKLQSLELDCAWRDSSAVKHVVDMINSVPLLETLWIGGGVDDETDGKLFEALIQSSSLKELGLKRVQWGAALLLKALAGDDGNRSIERLRLEHLPGLLGCLMELLICNPSLKEVELKSLQMSPEEWHQLGEFIRDNAIATTILVKFDFDREDSWQSVEALARAACSDVKDPTVELVLSARIYSELMLPLNLLGRVLRGEITSLKSLSILEGAKKLPLSVSSR